MFCVRPDTQGYRVAACVLGARQVRWCRVVGFVFVVVVGVVVGLLFLNSTWRRGGWLVSCVLAGLLLAWAVRWVGEHVSMATHGAPVGEPAACTRAWACAARGGLTVTMTKRGHTRFGAGHAPSSTHARHFSNRTPARYNLRVCTRLFWAQLYHLFSLNLYALYMHMTVFEQLFELAPRKRTPLMLHRHIV
jgi:hypothetical protein